MKPECSDIIQKAPKVIKDATVKAAKLNDKKHPAGYIEPLIKGIGNIGCPECGKKRHTKKSKCIKSQFT